MINETSKPENALRSIILNRDSKAFLALPNDEKQDFLIMLMYEYLSCKNMNEMNAVQKTLFLAMRLEDTCQADALPSLSEDEAVFLVLPEMKQSLERLGALKTAELLGEFIALLPIGTVPEWKWFFEEERTQTIGRIDGEIADYPDGSMSKRYLAYLADPEKADQLLENLA